MWLMYCFSVPAPITPPPPLLVISNNLFLNVPQHIFGIPHRTENKQMYTNYSIRL